MVRLRVRVAPRSAFPDIHPVFVTVAAAVLLLTAAACSHEKEFPTAPSTPTRTLVGLEIRGCSEEEGYQCRGYLVYTTKEEEEVSTRTSWYSDRSAIAAVDNKTGRVTPALGGSVLIQGYIRENGTDWRATQRITVRLPNVDIRGVVRESSFRPIAGATLEVWTGPSRGTTTTTDAQGAWALNVSPEFEFRIHVSRSGFEAKNFDILSPNGRITTQHDFVLQPFGTTPPSPPSPPPPPPQPAPPRAQDPITYEFQGRLEDSSSSRDAWCVDADGRSRRCQTFTLAASPHRTIDAELTWTTAGGMSIRTCCSASS